MTSLKQQIMDKWEEMELKRDMSKTVHERAWYQGIMDKLDEQYKRLSS